MSSPPRIADLEFSLCLALPYVGILLTAAVISSALILRFSRRVRAGVQAPGQRDGCLDGLRGLLALGVFIHHSFTACRYFAGADWAWSSSALFNHLGQSTVALFFMITGYLFSKRLLTAALPGRSVQWTALYISRLARLTPLYVLFVTAVVLSVFSLSDWTLRVPLSALGREVSAWYLFAVPGQPDINRLPDTWMLIAGVNWSLKYEWYFYFSLPILYWLLRPFAGTRAARLAVTGFACLLFAAIPRHRDIVGERLYVLHFGAGICAALILRDDLLGGWIRSRAFRVVALVAMLCLGFLLNDSHNAGAVGLTFVVFLAVLGGFSLGGFLQRPAVIWLGEISYGLYLIHGLLLYWTLHFLAKWGALRGLGLVEYTLVMVCLTAVLVCLASISFVFLEGPSIKLGRRLTVGRDGPTIPGGIMQKSA